MGTKKDSTIYDVAIYCRLSKEDLKEDGDRDESASIGTQKAILTEYVRQRGWHLVQTYVDVYNQKLIPFDTIKAVQTPKITAFEGKSACRKPLFLFFETMMPDCRIHQCTQQIRGGCICTQAK